MASFGTLCFDHLQNICPHSISPNLVNELVRRDSGFLLTAGSMTLMVARSPLASAYMGRHPSMKVGATKPMSELRGRSASA
jgi:hypothetical protein